MSSKLPEQQAEEYCKVLYVLMGKVQKIMRTFGKQRQKLQRQRNMGHKLKLTNREVTHIYRIRSFTDTRLKIKKESLDLGRKQRMINLTTKLTKLSPQLIVFQHLVCFGGHSSIDKGDWKENKKLFVVNQSKQTERSSSIITFGLVLCFMLFMVLMLHMYISVCLQ